MIHTSCPLKLRSNTQLVKNLLEKKRLLKQKDPSHKKYKTALIIEGGIFLGVYGAGIAWGLEEIGMTNAFDYVLGISTGTVTGAYFLSQQMEMGTSVFYEDLTDGQFLNFRRVKSIINMDYLNDIFATKKILATQQIRKARSELLFAVTNIVTGKGEILRAKDEDIDILTSIKEAMSLPGFYNKPTPIRGKAYCDGVYGFTNPIAYALEELGCTDVVVVTNRPCNFRSDPQLFTFLETIAAKTMLRNLSSEFRKAYISRRRSSSRDMAMLWEMGKDEFPGINLGLICRDTMPINRFSQNSKKIKEVAQDAKLQAIELFS